MPFRSYLMILQTFKQRVGGIFPSLSHSLIVFLYISAAKVYKFVKLLVSHDFREKEFFVFGFTAVFNSLQQEQNVDPYEFIDEDGQPPVADFRSSRSEEYLRGKVSGKSCL